MNVKEQIINILRQDARISNERIAVMLDVTPKEVEKMIEELEDDGIIIGYTAITNDEKQDKNFVCALIDVKVSPQASCGYDGVADKIAAYREVSSVYLMSGGYDLSVTIKGRNLREVAMFVTERLAPLDGVISTTTHFILHRYKEKDKMFTRDTDERSLVSP